MRTFQSLQTDIGMAIAGVDRIQPDSTQAIEAVNISQDANNQAEWFFDVAVPDELAQTADRPWLFMAGVGLASLGAANYALRALKVRREIANLSDPDSDLRRQASGRSVDINARTTELKVDRLGFRRGLALTVGSGIVLMALSNPVDVKELRINSRVTMVVAAGEDSTAKDISDSSGEDPNRYEGAVRALKQVVADSSGLEVNFITATPYDLEAVLVTGENIETPDLTNRDFIGRADLTAGVEAAGTSGTPVIIMSGDLSGLQERREVRDLVEAGTSVTVVVSGKSGTPIEVQGGPKIANYSSEFDDPIDGVQVVEADSVEEMVDIINDFDEQNNKSVKSEAVLKEILMLTSAAVLGGALVIDRFKAFFERRKARKIMDAQE